MAGGGSKPGEHRGGRKKGTPNRATLERALVAEREMAKADPRAVKTFRLAKEVLREFMEAFGGLATHYQPRRLINDGKVTLTGDLEQFGRWSELAVKCAIALAPYESPRLNAITVVPPAPEAKQDEREFTLNVFDHEGQPTGKVIHLIPPAKKAAT